MTEVIAIFDIGKTNKKILLFDESLKPVYQHEEKFSEISDEDGFPCDDIEKIRVWMLNIIEAIISKGDYNIIALNFSTCGATLGYLDDSGKILTPIYNYLKAMPEGMAESIYDKYGGKTEFCRCTASPALGFLNSGLQILWLKRTRPEVFKKLDSILHFPQLLSYMFTGKKVSEFTSIGCHTAMWDFDKMKYHAWLQDEGIKLPQPISNMESYFPENKKFTFRTGIGIHDSSASLAPYILESQVEFILISTGTWSINMNPFNHEPLTKEQLDNDCLSFLSINQKPVKSSRLFMGRIHDLNLERINRHFRADSQRYKSVKLNRELMKKLSDKGSCFFRNGIPDDNIDITADLTRFSNFEEAYHQLIIDLTDINIKSIQYVLPETNNIQNIYISGGFSKNEIFVACLATRFPGKRVFTSDFENSSALGAALMVYKEFGRDKHAKIDLGLKEWV